MATFGFILLNIDFPVGPVGLSPTRANFLLVFFAHQAQRVVDNEVEMSTIIRARLSGWKEMKPRALSPLNRAIEFGFEALD